MFWLTILAATISVLKAQLLLSNFTIKDLRAEDGWYEFNYGQVDEPPFNMLRLQVGLMAPRDGAVGIAEFGMNRCYLEVTDAFCPGDRFEVIELGTGSTGSQTILTTPEVDYNPSVARDICDGFPVQCTNSTSNPDVAFYDPTWSSGRVFLPAGNHSVVIKPIASPYCSGAGFVRIHCTGQPQPPPIPPSPVPGMMCNYSEGGFRMVMKPVAGPVAGAVCSSMGMKLAQIDNSNFVTSTNVAFKCSGPLSTSWIGSWNGQSWVGQEGLGLTVSTASPGGSINVYNDGKLRNVLCQEV